MRWMMLRPVVGSKATAKRVDRSSGNPLNILLPLVRWSRAPTLSAPCPDPVVTFCLHLPFAVLGIRFGPASSEAMQENRYADAETG
jgi:hypothetical protein